MKGQLLLGAVALLPIFPGPLALAEEIQLRVFSEFQRIDPFGAVIDLDRAPKPREILSPAVIRNGHFSLHVAVTAPPKSMYFLAVQMYPPEAFRWKLYEEKFAFDGQRWIPDALEELSPPYFGVVPDPDQAIEGQNTCVYLLDVFVPADLPPGKVRLEVLAKFDRWRMWPMEVRILGARIADLAQGPLTVVLPPPTAPADAAARAALSSYASNRQEVAPALVRSLRSVVWRNAWQDLALARQLENRMPREEILKRLTQILDAARGQGAEGYLRVRDFLIREASLQDPHCGENPRLGPRFWLAWRGATRFVPGAVEAGAP
ncbi:MAG: hypothetical protein NZV14_02115 [Bryobacteraceae bacterium]|nr:hypothetical protein [Bryobacteraceae bacterium]MDW8376925.1 hypothetical protein [Bryobacterales bacterium]